MYTCRVISLHLYAWMCVMYSECILINCERVLVFVHHCVHVCASGTGTCLHPIRKAGDAGAASPPGEAPSSGFVYTIGVNYRCSGIR